VNDDFLKSSRAILDEQNQIKKILEEENRLQGLLDDHNVFTKIADEQKRQLTATDTIAKHIKEIEKQELGFLSASTIGSAIQAFQEEQKTWHKRIGSEVIAANSIGATIAKYRESLDFSKSVLSLQTVHQESLASIQRAMTSMKSPWLDALQTSRSIRGFAELQAIGYALKTAPLFGAQFTDALRLDLGDWRDPIVWSETIFVDTAARTSFYVERGLNTELTDFSEETFEESLSIAGFNREPPALVSLYGSPFSPMSGDQTEEHARNLYAYDWLLRLETQIRNFIARVMVEAFGAKWEKQKVPAPMYQAWLERKQTDETAGRSPAPLIAYADFTDYVPLIIKKDNWPAFAPFFLRAEDVRESFQRLYPLRLGTMHARMITREDQLLLFTETRRLMKAIRSKQPAS
jgi:uncharacterized protein YukE